MPGPPPKLPDVRRNTSAPRDGEWKHAPGVGWQHGRTPSAPSGLTESSKRAWKAWMGSWMASFWQREDLPALERLIRCHDEVERNERFDGEGRAPAIPYSELRQLMDRFGLNPMARQKLRWLPPVDDPGTDKTKPAAGEESGPYGHLRAI